jgi:hypothetical protein
LNEKSSGKKEVTYSFPVDPDLWRAVRIHALENGVTLRKLIDFLLRQELREKRFHEAQP